MHPNQKISLKSFDPQTKMNYKLALLLSLLWQQVTSTVPSSRKIVEKSYYQDVFAIRGGTAVQVAFLNRKKKIEPSSPSNFLDATGKYVGGKVQLIYDTGVPTEISSGFILGYCSGFALKKISQGAAFILGMSYLGLKVLDHYGYIEVHHTKIKNQMELALDWNKDGKINVKDVNMMYDKGMGILGSSIPSVTGFSTGFLCGLRY